jgi:hypothetical protein
MATKKIKTDKTPTTDTNMKVLSIVNDVVLTAILTTCAISLLIFALTVAQKITITVGK